MAQTTNSDWSGWVYFAGVLMLVRGAFQVFEGILALANGKFFVVTPNAIATFNITAWGWIHIALGVVLLTAAASVFSGRLWGRVIGSIMTALALAVNLAWLPAYPVWSLTAAALDVVILYALIVRGDDVKA